MPRRSTGPRLYLDEARGQWAVRDGTRFIRTRCGAGNRDDAERWLQAYLVKKHAPQPSDDPLIDEILSVYGREHAQSTARPRDCAYYIGNLLKKWRGRTVSEINAKTCRAYTASKKSGGARRDLEVLRAAINHWHREHGPLKAVPVIVLPPRGEPRDRWLTRSEAARLLWAARHTEHLKRFILVGLHTGSRAGVILALQWSWIDWETGVMRRRAPGEVDRQNKRRPPVKLRTSLKGFLRRWRRQDAGRSTHVVQFGGHAVSHLRRAWQSACVAAELPDISPHILRHTKATWLMRDGAAPWAAANFLGMTVSMLESVYGHHAVAFQGDVADL